MNMQTRNPEVPVAKWPFEPTVKALGDVEIVNPALRKVLAERTRRQ
jgi:hypothetical protein